MANVYASPITDARVSKLRALCKIRDDNVAQTPQSAQQTEVYEQAPLINPEVLNGNESRNSADRSAPAGDKRKCTGNNR